MERERTRDEFADLEAGLLIDKYALDEELQAQPDMFYRVAKALALRTSQLAAAKQDVDEQKARADLLIRRTIRSNEEKVTEKEVEARVRITKSVIDALNLHAELSAVVGQLTALKEAFQQRSYALKDLAGLHVAEYYTANEHSAARSAMRQGSDGSKERRVLRDARKAAGR